MIERNQTGPLTGTLYHQMLTLAIKILRRHCDEVNSLNVYPVPDGDTGTNMLLTLEAAQKRISDPEAPLGVVAAESSTGSLMGARGNSGVILSQLFRGIAAGLEGKEIANPLEVAEALEAGVRAAYSAVMRPVEGTILTVARFSAKAAKAHAEEGGDLRAVLASAWQRSEEILQRTPEMLDVLAEAGVVDAGGQGLVYILAGALQAVDQGELPTPEPMEKMPEVPSRPLSALTYPFDVVLLMNRDPDQSFNPASARQQLEALGDSLVMVEERTMIKIHIHTDRILDVMRTALSWGDLVESQIENMEVQMAESSPNGTLPDRFVTAEGRSTYAVLPILAGLGLEEVFRSLGAVAVIRGGPTMNPSTEDVLREVEAADADAVILLPNNSNLILVCQQAQQLSERSVHIVPTINVPQGLAAMMARASIRDVQTAVRRMGEAAGAVTAIEVTYAIDNRRFGGTDLEKGDIIGFCDSELRSVGENPEQVLIEVLRDAQATKGLRMLTVFAGQMIDDIDGLRERLEKAFDDLEIDVFYGGQDHYYFLAAAE